MKALITLIVFAISASASAAPIEVARRFIASKATDTGAGYSINTETGKAVLYFWASQRVSSYNGTGVTSGNYVSDVFYRATLPIEGLRYDTASHEIVFTDAAGAERVCANVRTGRGFFRNRIVINPTGYCELSAHLERHNRMYDIVSVIFGIR
jgi:hypothetical protein